MLVRHGERDRAGADAHVEHAWSWLTVEERERPLDEELRLGSRDERSRVAAQRQSTEVPLAEQVGERLAPAAALHEAASDGELAVGERPLEGGVELDPGQSERVREQPLSVEARRVDAFPLQELGG